jgi:hypothetical protein
MHGTNIKLLEAGGLSLRNIGAVIVTHYTVSLTQIIAGHSEMYFKHSIYTLFLIMQNS